MSNSLSKLVADWGGFEELIKEMNSTGSVTVERDVRLDGRSGASRQIDVLITHREGFYEHKVIAECKYWNKPVSRLHVDALSTTIKEVGASKGVIFSIEGFQEGAITQAKSEGISLFKVREPTVEEWGLPGRHIDFWLHVIGVSIGRFRLHDSTTFHGYEPGDTNLALRLGDGLRSHTPINYTGRPEKTLEELLENCVMDGARQVVRPWVFRFDDSDDVTMRGVTRVNIAPRKPIVTLHAGGVLVVPKISFDLGIEILQSRLQFDRGKDALFVLSVEDCVSQTVHAAAKYTGDEFTTIKQLDLNMEDAAESVKNGDVFQLWTAGYQDFSKFLDLAPGLMHRIYKD